MVHPTSQSVRPAARVRPRRARFYSPGSTLPHCGSAEHLESRTLLSVAAVEETLVNISKMRDNQTEATISIDPTNPNRLFASSNMGSARDPDIGANDPIPNLNSLFGATSSDGGVTWATRLFATGAVANGGDNLPAACCDPSAEFDQFGNLWFTYIGDPLAGPDPSGFHTFVLLSTDGGQSFSLVSDLGPGDHPTITTGANSVWLSWVDTLTQDLVASGASVTGLGAVALPAGYTPDPSGLRGAFIAPQAAPDSFAGNVGDIAIGPTGAVMVDYQFEAGLDSPQLQTPSKVMVHLDPDGFGPQGFGPGVIATSTNVAGRDEIPAQNRRTVHSEPNIEWDRSGGPFTGRVYMSYTDEVEFESALGNNADLDIYVRFSDDNGAHWSDRLLVNDDVGIGAPLARAQFLPQIALDQTTGNIAIGFHDARNDTGADRNPNDDVQYFVAVGQPTPDRSSIVFAPNVRVGVGQSDARFADNAIDYGDYTGLTFYGNTAYPAFADNSNSTRDNPAGARRSFDVYTGRVRVTDTTVPPPPAVTPNSPLAPTVIKENALIKKGRFYNLNVSYTAPQGTFIDTATLGDNDLTVTGPNGFSGPMELRGFKRRLKGANVLAKYRVAAPGADAKFDASDNGIYTIVLNADAVRASNGTASTAGVISKFLVTAPAPRTRGRSLELAAALPPSAAVTQAAPDKDDDVATGLLTA